MIQTLNKANTKSKYAWYIAAAAVCLLMYGWFCYVVRFGMGREDAAAYLLQTQRLVQGDRLLVDDWHFAQFSAFISYIPYLLFVKLTGSTDGIILFNRYFYLFVSFLTYWYIFLKMKKISVIKATVCAVLFCGFVPFCLFCLNNYNVPLLMCLFVSFVFTEKQKKHHSVKLIAAGIAFSFAVLLSPGMAFLFAVYSFLVLICFLGKKRGKALFPSCGFVLDGKIWFFFSIGILISVVAFFVYLQVTSGWGNIIRSLPNLFGSSVYDFSAGGEAWSFLSDRLHRAVLQYHPASLIFAAALLLGAAAYKIYKKRQQKKPCVKQKLFLFALLNAAGLFACVCAVISKFESVESWNYWFYHSDLYVPVFVFCCICYVLCDEKNPYAVFYLALGFGLSILKDIFSDATFGIGCVFSVFALVDIYPQAVKEIKQQLDGETHRVRKDTAGKRRTQKLFHVFIAVMLVFFACWSLVSIAVQSEYAVCEYDTQAKKETPAAEPISSGPYKGIYTSQRVKTKYMDSLDDLDKMTEASDAGIYVMRAFPYCNLYTGRECASYSVWVNEEEIGSRLVDYWILFPERRPGMIYIPDYDFDYSESDYGTLIFDEIRACFKYRETDGAAGKIIIIERWNI